MYVTYMRSIIWNCYAVFLLHKPPFVRHYHKQLVHFSTLFVAQILQTGRCKTWTLDSGLDSWTGLGFGLTQSSVTTISYHVLVQRMSTVPTSGQCCKWCKPVDGPLYRVCATIGNCILSCTACTKVTGTWAQIQDTNHTMNETRAYGMWL